MTNEYELIRLGEVDSQGDIISPDDFPDVDGQSVRVTVGFGLQVIGRATLRREGNCIMAAVEFGQGLAPAFDFALAAGMQASLQKDYPNGEGTKPVVLHVTSMVSCGVVRPEEKVQ